MPFDSFFNCSALVFSADVRDMAPIASSLTLMAPHTRPKILSHAVLFQKKVAKGRRFL